MRDEQRQTMKIELLSQWELEAESRNYFLDRPRPPVPLTKKVIKNSFYASPRLQNCSIARILLDPLLFGQCQQRNKWILGCTVYYTGES